MAGSSEEATYEYEIHERDEIIDAVRASRVRQIFVEFLQQGSPKPHVVLRFNIDPVNVGDQTYLGCRFAMNLEGGVEGVFCISPLRYDNTSHAAHTAFEFRLKISDWTVDNVLGAITYLDDLLDFSFTAGFGVPGDGNDYVDGCRDFISQAFILLHRYGFVGWRVHRIDRGVFNSMNLNVRVGRTGFHEIIGYNYRYAHNRSHPTLVQSLPLARGIFHAEGFRRTLVYQADDRHHYRLPYLPESLEQGDEGYYPGPVSYSQY